MKQHPRGCQRFKGGCGIGIFYLKNPSICRVRHLCHGDARRAWHCFWLTPVHYCRHWYGVASASALFASRLYRSDYLSASTLSTVVCWHPSSVPDMYLSLIIESLQTMPPRSAKRTSCLADSDFLQPTSWEFGQPSSDWVYGNRWNRGVGSIPGETAGKTNQVNPYTSTDIGTETEKLVDLCIHCRQARMNAIVQDISHASSVL